MYETSSLDLAAYLMVKKISLMGAYKSDKGTVVFKFPDTDLLQSLIMDFFNSDYKAYFDAIKKLKGVIYEIK